MHVLAAAGSSANGPGGAAQALLLGSAAGVVFALQAAVTKVFMTELGHGASALLGSWTTYALVASAIAGFVLQQSALRTNVPAGTGHYRAGIRADRYRPAGRG